MANHLLPATENSMGDLIAMQEGDLEMYWIVTQGVHDWAARYLPDLNEVLLLIRKQIQRLGATTPARLRAVYNGSLASMMETANFLASWNYFDHQTKADL